MDSKEFGRRLRLLRKTLKLNQTEFAQKIGVKQTTLSGYENGSNSPSLEVLTAIASTFHISINWLVGISESAFQISSVADIADFIFKMDDLNEIKYELEINDKLPNDLETDENKWYCSIKFYGRSKDHPRNEDVCEMLSSVAEDRSEYESYFMSKESYDHCKEDILNQYSDDLLTQKDQPEIDYATRIKLRDKLIEKRFEEQNKKN